ncbi:carbohydrate esterase family 8 protein [Morchella snyderi]|nr:carbohydrate esterase family 8 protein [Morchella snyderi]
MLLSQIAFLAFAQLVLAASRTSPPTGCIVVSPSATSGQYSTLQSAVSSLSTTSSAAQCIFIYAGTYSEQVYIPARAALLTIYGETTDTTSYASNTVTITQGKSQDDSANNDATATIRAFSVGLKIYNVNIANTRGKGSQAVALSSQGDQQGFYGLKLTGYQDTVLANEGFAVYAKSYIDGATDFIFGQRQRAWFDGVDIRVKANGWVTANGRDSESNVSYYVFNKCTVAAASGYTVTAGTQYLGRPWRDYSRVVFQNSALSAVINSAGWSVWSSSDANTEYVYYKEFGNTGTGASGTRASFSGSLSAAVSISTILGSSYTSWVDTSYLS